eukprot:scaffold12643_cov49-Cylindrotheca_fusiformis.AAC.2
MVMVVGLGSSNSMASNILVMIRAEPREHHASNSIQEESWNHCNILVMFRAQPREHASILSKNLGKFGLIGVFSQDSQSTCWKVAIL